MRKIGGTFPLEPTLSTDNGFFDKICPPGGDVCFMMSGRCGMYRCLEDILLTDTKKVAYVPMYTCETVLAPFEKAGYTLKFYEVDKDLRCIFDPSVIDEISLLSLCGYYGFCNYDRDFVRACKERGVVIIEDCTHSLLTEGGVDPLCDYAAGSFRKWLGVTCGGWGVKVNGKFGVPYQPTHERHLNLRKQLIVDEKGDMFWEGEMLLRQIFDSFVGDEQSEYVMRHADLQEIADKRRANFTSLLNALPKETKGFRPVFPELKDGVVPTHFCIYADQRDELQQYLADRGIHSTVYWPKAPAVDLEGHDTVRYVYDHIMSLSLDQRYGAEDMQYIADALIEYSNAFQG